MKLNVSQLDKLRSFCFDGTLDCVVINPHHTGFVSVLTTMRKGGGGIGIFHHLMDCNGEIQDTELIDPEAKEIP